jgi:HemY protein
MRFVTWIAVLSISAVLAAWLTANNHGHVTLYWNQIRMDLSMNLFIFSLFGLFVMSFFVLRLIASIIDLPQRAATYRRGQREVRAVQGISHAIDHLFAGRYAKALKAAQVSAQYSHVSDIACLIAANASHRLKRSEDRDVWLEKIQGEAHQQARLVMTAEMQLDERDAQGALQTIQKLQKGGARQFLVQHIALRANQLMKNWEEVIRLTGLLAKRNILHPLVARSRIQEALSNLSQQKNLNPQTLLKVWGELSKEDRLSPSLVKAAAQGLIAAGELVQAKKILEEALNHEPHADLLDIYPDCVGDKTIEEKEFAKNPLPLIQSVEGWLQKNPAEPALHLALGRLCMTQKLWGKAKSSLSQVIRAPRATPMMEAQAHMALSSIYEVLDEPLEAATHYKAAAKLLL